jgi:hypothetical protein
VRVRTAFLMSLQTVGMCLLASCGGSSSPTVTLLPTYPNISGNWAIAVTSTPAGALDVSGSLTSNGKNVNGQLLIISSCFAPVLGTGPQQLDIGIPFTGTVDSTGNVKLVSSPSNGQVVTLSGVVSSDGSTLAGGRYSVVGGCADKDSGTATGYRVPNISGTYTGSGTLGGGALGSTPQQITVSGQITQASVATDFSYPLSSSITVSGIPCFSSGTSMSQPFGGFIFGKQFIVIYTMNDGSQFSLSGEVDATGKVLTTIFLVTSGACNLDFANGTLTRP